MEKQVKLDPGDGDPASSRLVLLHGRFPETLPRTLRRWGYRTEPVREPADSRPPVGASFSATPDRYRAAAAVVCGESAGASRLLRRLRAAGTPGVLVRAPEYLPDEGIAGVVYPDWPGAEEVRRAVIRLVSCPPSARETAVPIDAFRALLRERFGLTFPVRRRQEIEAAVRRRMAALRLPSPGYYLDRLRQAPRDTPDREIDHLLESLLVGETYLNRTPAHFETLLTQKLPEILEAYPDTTVRALSAGCSSGEEAYCLAAVLRQRLPARRVEVVGTDVHRRALAVARRGRYASYSLRSSLPPEMAAYFKADADGVTVSPELARSVRFQYLNLVDGTQDPGSRPLEDLDIIFCRNVLLYFDPAAARRALRQLAARLRPGGALFLGPSESVLGGDVDLRVRAGADCFYLEKPRIVPAPPRRPATRPPPPPPPPPPGHPAPVDLELEPLSAPPWQPRPRRDSRAAVPDPPDPVAEGFRLLDEEDFDAARDRFLAATRAGAAPEAELGLLFLDANAGRYDAALAGCARLAAAGSTLPGVFYLSGLLEDQHGRPLAAEEGFRRALFLDQNCYMARFHLAELLARRGDDAGASREAQNLLEQLRMLEPGALVPWGGGMAREALETLCLGLLRGPESGGRT